MRRDVATEIQRLADSCVAELEGTCNGLDPRTSSAHALWQLHVAGVLGAMVSYLATPAWRAHPDLFPQEEVEVMEERYVLPQDVALRGQAAVERVRQKLDGLQQLDATDDAVAKGYGEMRRRLQELQDYLDTVVGTDKAGQGTGA